MFLMGSSAWAAEAVKVGEFEQGRAHYAEGNYEEALEHFLTAEKSEPANGEVQYNIGLVYQGMLDYTGAEKAFTRAVELDPAMGDAWSHLGEMQYRQGKHAEAKVSLLKAEENGARPAYAAYIKGLALMGLGEHDAAIVSLNRCQELEPGFRQKALYAIGMVHTSNNNKQLAEQAFREAMAINPKNVIGIYSNFGLQNILRPQKRPWSVGLNYSFQYDDNAITSPDGQIISLPAGQSQGDFKHIVNLYGNIKPEFKGPFGIRFDGSYYKSMHQKLSYMNLDALSLSVTPSYNLGFGTFSLGVRKDIYLLGSHRYMQGNGLFPNFGFGIGKSQHGMLYGGYQKKKFAHQMAVANTANDRDATNYLAGYTHYLYFSEQQGYVGLGYARDVENTKGNNWDYKGNRFTGSLLYPVAEGIKLRFTGDYYQQRYWKVQTGLAIAGVKRSDRITTLAPSLTYQTKWGILQLQYTYTNAKSNIAVYNYTRNIVGAGIEVSY